MTDTKQAYNEWSSQYDGNINPTRDLEAASLVQMVGPLSFDHCLEIGCGTGKNTAWLKTKAKYVTGLDFSPEMLAIAKSKIKDENVHFVEADITKDWDFTDRTYDMISFSLVLEHVQDLEEIFRKTDKALKANGYVYIGELHPFKQYNGSKARFENKDGVQVLTCHLHHISEFTDAAKKQGLNLVELRECFDSENKEKVPRILSLLFQKPGTIS